MCSCFIRNNNTISSILLMHNPFPTYFKTQGVVSEPIVDAVYAACGHLNDLMAWRIKRGCCNVLTCCWMVLQYAICYGRLCSQQVCVCSSQKLLAVPASRLAFPCRAFTLERTCRWGVARTIHAAHSLASTSPAMWRRRTARNMLMRAWSTSAQGGSVRMTPAPNTQRTTSKG